MNKSASIVLFILLLLLMIFTIVKVSLESNLFNELPELLKIPWMQATLVDFYTNVFILFLWITYKEKKHYKKLIWLILLVILGSVATCIYILKELIQLKKSENLKDLLTKQND